jgi:hypothetical protein
VTDSVGDYILLLYGINYGCKKLYSIDPGLFSGESCCFNASSSIFKKPLFQSLWNAEIIFAQTNAANIFSSNLQTILVNKLECFSLLYR